MQLITYMLIARLTCIIVTKLDTFLKKKKMISLPTYLHLADRVRIGETLKTLFYFWPNWYNTII